MKLMQHFFLFVSIIISFETFIKDRLKIFLANSRLAPVADPGSETVGTILSFSLTLKLSVLSRQCRSCNSQLSPEQTTIIGAGVH